MDEKEEAIPKASRSRWTAWLSLYARLEALIKE